MPPADTQEWLAQAMTVAELVGEWPTYSIVEILGVRGDRLVAGRSRTHAGPTVESAMVVVARTDEQADRFECLYFFDFEDLDEAIAELDRLHAELEAELP